MSTSEPRIYVACLSSYSNGKLHGKWINCFNTTADQIEEQIEAMLESSPEEDAEEWGIHDFEGFGEYKVSENEDLDNLVELVDLIEEYGEVALAVTEFEVHVDRIKLLCEEGYIGTYTDRGDWAAEYLKDTDILPDNKLVTMYFDYEAYARDTELNGDVYFVEVGYNKVLAFDGSI
jgi:antirestriction protein